ncbi:MAG: hypothetical protein VB934_15160 [Polyangiaceae bacterium]
MMPRIVFVGLVVLSLGACKAEDLGDRITIVCPDRAVFTEHVSELMERRCGTLDCHGSDYRPMRLYGELGLRHSSELNRSGGNATTASERFANYLAVCSVQPEKTADVALDPAGQAVNQLLLVLKGRGKEGHKGGKVFNPFDDADLCVVGWLRGDHVNSVSQACKAALARLP